MKQSRLEARDYFVESGFSVPTILSIMEGRVTKKTLYNWRNNVDGSDPEGTWDEQRKAKIELISSLRENVIKLAISTAAEAVLDKSKTNLNAAYKAIGILKAYQGLDLTKILPVDEVEDEKKKVDPEEIIKRVENILGA